MVFPHPLGVVSPEELLVCSSAVVFSFCHKCCAPYYPAWEFYLDTCLSPPQMSVWTSGIRRQVIWAERFLLGDWYVGHLSPDTLCSFWNQSLNQSVWFFTAGWMDKHLTKCLLNFHPEVQVRCCPEVPSSSVILWMYDWYFGNGAITLYICDVSVTAHLPEISVWSREMREKWLV